jgi:hypothetical protein
MGKGHAKPPTLKTQPTASSWTIDIEHFDALIVGAGLTGPAASAVTSCFALGCSV